MGKVQAFLHLNIQRVGEGIVVQEKQSLSFTLSCCLFCLIFYEILAMQNDFSYYTTIMNPNPCFYKYIST